MKFGSPELIHNQNPIEKITREDISREIIEPGETEIIMQRHEKYIRDLTHERSGSLESEDAQKAFDQAVEILENKLKNLSTEGVESLDVLVIASNTKYGENEEMRSFETAQEVVKGIQSVLEKYGLDSKHLLNSNSAVSKNNGSVLPSKNATIQEPRMFEESPEFVSYLKSKYGDLTQQFWQAFEEDWEKDKRMEMEAEGPKEILNRYAKFIEILRNFSAFYHEKHPGRRLIIWPVSHYDTISPYVKNKVMKSDPNQFLPVDYGAGISLKIDKEGKMISEIQGVEFSID